MGRIGGDFEFQFGVEHLGRYRTGEL
jgi:hypothetical protein